MTVSQFTVQDIQNLECLKTLDLSMGKFVKQFEEEFASKLGAKYAVMVNSGSSANLLAISCLKSCYNSIISISLPVVTWPTTLWPIVQLGLVPIFEDVDINRLTVIPKCQPEVLFDTHLLGQPSHAKGNIVIEDCCEALGSKAYGNYCGTNGLMGTFSFYFSHHICTIEGGMLVTNDEELYKEALMQRSHGWTRHLPSYTHTSDNAFTFSSMGYNLRPTEINAELGLLQLPKLEAYISIRKQIADLYQSCVNYDLFYEYIIRETNSYFAFPVIAKSKATIDVLKNLLNKSNIPFRAIAGGNLLRQPFNKDYRFGDPEDFPNAQIIHDNGIYLTISTTMSNEIIDRSCHILHSVTNHI